MPGDTIQVEADISDDNELGSVTLKLLSASYTPVDHQESFAVNAKTYHLSYDYVINNAYLETGNYFLTLSASDGENDVNTFQAIVIYEIPKTRKAVYVLTAPDSMHVSVYKLDSANQFSSQFSIPGDYSASAIDSRNNRLNTVGKITGAFNQFDLVSNADLFSEPPYNTGIPSFSYMAFAHELSFVSYYDGRIRAFDKNGSVQFNSEQPVYYRPGVLCVSDNYVFAEAYYPGPNENRLVILFYPSGIAKQEFNAGFDIVSMMNRDNNEIILFGNKNGDGKIYFYSVVSNSMNDFHTLFSNTIHAAVAIDADRYAIATANGLYSYQVSSNNLIPVDLSEAVYSLEYDVVNGILFVNAGRTIREYDFPNASILNTVTSTDSIVDIRMQYSK